MYVSTFDVDASELTVDPALSWSI